MTLDQQSFKKRMKDLKGPFHSYDLSAATDRFPLAFQRFCVESIMGKEFAESWAYLMVGLPFSCKFKGVKSPITYNCGQPMGAYTSWAVFALCHHILVRVAGYNVYKHFSFDAYFILGDDILIADVKVANQYSRLMVDVLGVTINTSKSIISDNSFEFAKRILVDNVDCSPITWTQ